MASLVGCLALTAAARPLSGPPPRTPRQGSQQGAARPGPHYGPTRGNLVRSQTVRCAVAETGIFSITCFFSKTGIFGNLFVSCRRFICFVHIWPLSSVRIYSFVSVLFGRGVRCRPATGEPWHCGPSSQGSRSTPSLSTLALSLHAGNAILVPLEMVDLSSSDSSPAWPGGPERANPGPVSPASQLFVCYQTQPVLEETF